MPVNTASHVCACHQWAIFLHKFLPPHTAHLMKKKIICIEEESDGKTRQRLCYKDYSGRRGYHTTFSEPVSLLQRRAFILLTSLPPALRSTAARCLTAPSPPPAHHCRRAPPAPRCCSPACAAHGRAAACRATCYTAFLCLPACHTLLHSCHASGCHHLIYLLTFFTFSLCLFAATISVPTPCTRWRATPTGVPPAPLPFPFGGGGLF